MSATSAVRATEMGAPAPVSTIEGFLVDLSRYNFRPEDRNPIATLLSRSARCVARFTQSRGTWSLIARGGERSARCRRPRWRRRLQRPSGSASRGVSGRRMRSRRPTASIGSSRGRGRRRDHAQPNLVARPYSAPRAPADGHTGASLPVAAGRRSPGFLSPGVQVDGPSFDAGTWAGRLCGVRPHRPPFGTGATVGCPENG